MNIKNKSVYFILEMGNCCKKNKSEDERYAELTKTILVPTVELEPQFFDEKRLSDIYKYYDDALYESYYADIKITV